MLIDRLLAPVLAVDVGIDHAALQGTGAIKGHAGDDVADVVGPHALEQFSDAVGFELKHAAGVAALEQGIGFAIVKRQAMEIDLRVASLCDQPYRVVQQGERTQAEKVHLEQADFFQIAHAPLRRHRHLPLEDGGWRIEDGGWPVVSRAFAARSILHPRSSIFAAPGIAFPDDALQRHVVGQRTVGDDDAGGMGAGVAIGAFQLAGDVDQLLDLRVALVLSFQVGILLESLIERRCPASAGSSWRSDPRGPAGG